MYYTICTRLCMRRRLFTRSAFNPPLSALWISVLNNLHQYDQFPVWIAIFFGKKTRNLIIFFIKGSAVSLSEGSPMRMSGITTKCYQWCFAASILVGAAMTLQAKWLAIHNDFEMYDLDGKAIQVRSGCLCKFGTTYYWYGCDQAMTNQTCYSSDDLLHWTNKGNMVTASRGTNRMDVVYNDSTKQYVMVMKYQLSTNWCDRAIATSSTPDGPFTFKFDSLVYGFKTGDMSVWKDDDGKAYYMYEWDSLDVFSLQYALLTQDYMGLARRMPGRWNGGEREAPMMIKRHGLYYYLSSQTAGINSSETKYYTAHSLDGPWTTTLVPIIAPGNTKKNSWDTQCDFVFVFKGTKDTVYMYDGDRWVKPDPMRVGDYAWLPITFSPKDSVIINYYQDWEIDPDVGIWRPIDSKRNLALHKTAAASSTNGNNAANNVTDSATWQNYTSTKWTSASSDPQWIRIDLGSPMSINRVILKWDSAYAKSFKIQVSIDTATWTDVFSTAKAGLRCVTDETFPAATSRYVRMYGTQRGTSGGYSLFEFMVLNDSGVTASTFKSGKSAISSEGFLTCKNNTIRYRVPTGNSVKLDVVDAHGKLVAVLVDGFKHAGDHEAVLPGTVGRGMHVIRLTIGTKKLAAVQVRL